MSVENKGQKEYASVLLAEEVPQTLAELTLAGRRQPLQPGDTIYLVVAVVLHPLDVWGNDGTQLLLAQKEKTPYTKDVRTLEDALGDERIYVVDASNFDKIEKCTCVCVCLYKRLET